MDIYFEYYNGDWASILFGEGVFDGCGDIIVHAESGDYYLNNNTGALTLKRGEYYTYGDIVWDIQARFDINPPYLVVTIENGSYTLDRDGNFIELAIELSNVDEDAYNKFVLAFENTLGSGADATDMGVNMKKEWHANDLYYIVEWDLTSTLSINITKE